MKKNNRYYFDMDGVLAVWDTTSTKADTHEVGYFLEREQDEYIKEIILSLIEASEDVTMLTAVYTDGKAAEEKRTWLDQMGLAHVPMIAVPYGSPKHLFIDADPNVNHILIDDYTVNLKEWVVLASEAEEEEEAEVAEEDEESSFCTTSTTMSRKRHRQRQHCVQQPQLHE